MFGCIWDRFIAALNSVKMSQSVAINAKFMPRSRIWTCHYECARSTPLLNSCFSVFCNVWVPSGPFRYCTKLGAKRTELVQLMQKFMPRSGVRFFRYEHTRSTPMNSCFGVFRNVWVHLGPFRYRRKLGPKWAELVQLMQKFVPRRHIRISRNVRTWSTPFYPNLMFYFVLWCLGASGNISSPYETWLKWAELVQLMQKFMPRSHVRTFR